MELSSVTHIESESLTGIRADVFVCTLSPEQRSITIPRLFEKLDCRKVALVPAGNKDQASVRSNLEYLSQNEFEIIPVVSDVPDISGILKGAAGDEVDLVVDCTSMSQGWYYEFLRWFDESQADFQRARLRFTYTMGAYIEEEASGKLRRVKDFLKHESRKRKSKKALILGLGHEPGVAEAICRIEKPDQLFLFYADPPVDKRFVSKVFVNNHQLIQETPIRNLVAYPVSNGQEIYQNLVNTILPLRNEYQIALIPGGPKIFSVAAMLVHLGYPDTRISYPVFKRNPSQDREASGQPVVLDVHFEGEE